MENTFEESTRNGNGGEPRDPYTVIRHETLGNHKAIINNITVDKGIPLPPRNCGPKLRAKRNDIEIALLTMDVGDSIYIPKQLVNQAKTALARFAKMRSMKRQNKEAKHRYATRQLEPKHPAFRVWRVK